MALQSVNPASEEVIERFEPHGESEIEAALEAAASRFASWRREPVVERAAWLRRAAQVLETHRATYARHMTAEMGKTLAAADAEIGKCAWVCRYYADHGPDMLADQVIESDASQSHVMHLPLGPVLAVMPWNFPFWQVFRFAAPALMAGNVALLKHASNVGRCALDIEAVFREAGLPEACFQTLMIDASSVERVIRDPRVKAATLTGSGPAGAAVAGAAGQEIKPTVLELGGTDAFIVMPSADLDAAVSTAVEARVMNNGQSCIAAKRFFVHGDIYEAFRERFVAGFEALTLGDPMQADTDIGPLAQREGREAVSGQVQRTLEAGGQRISRPAELPERGWYFAPQVIEDAPFSSPAFTEEVFGPVAGLWRVDSLEEAISHANNSAFGLGSAIFTHEPSEMVVAARDIEAGSTFVNSKVASDPRLPFGGVKQSGYGRELARDGLMAFVNRKTISMA
ncbi:MAG: aldehyde dehydrogenase family protein [Alphaproteobacteria bacterium]|jgi:succinate-semialdehyde dehydrogenase/glutarate-semialdehyde dehydrogenase|nr:aldehyde dehydrogenase family protein [Alphaproteobacteria bacterium]